MWVLSWVPPSLWYSQNFPVSEVSSLMILQPDRCDFFYFNLLYTFVAAPIQAQVVRGTEDKNLINLQLDGWYIKFLSSPIICLTVFTFQIPAIAAPWILSRFYGHIQGENHGGVWLLNHVLSMLVSQTCTSKSAVEYFFPCIVLWSLLCGVHKLSLPLRLETLECITMVETETEPIDGVQRIQMLSSWGLLC